jgi:hypothetical protein
LGGGSVADINVERRGPAIWPFLVGAIVLGLLIWGLIRLFDRDEATRIDTPEVTTEQTVPAAGQGR